MSEQVRFTVRVDPSCGKVFLTSDLPDVGAPREFYFESGRQTDEYVAFCHEAEGALAAFLQTVRVGKLYREGE